LGRRISKISSGVTQQFIYDGNDVLLKYTDGVLSKRFTNGPRIDEPLVMHDVTEGQNFFYHSDSLGSITAVTDSTGLLIESYKYTSYGQPTIYDKDGLVITESEIKNPHLFTGREYDFETGTYFHRNRYRFADLGIWLSKDPQGFDDGPNLYSYVGNNPVNYIDPWGLARIWWPPEFWKGPRYGNWGGGKWSGGWDVDYHGDKMGNAPYVDSLDFCCQKHDFCWYKCDKKFPCEKDKDKRKECIRNCNLELIDCLKRLDDDPRKWKEPPTRGTEDDARKYRDDAIWWFSQER
jgi:RHS repeat-associated protein